MDRLLRAEIVSEVKRAQAEMAELYNELWLTGEQLCERMAMFTPSWIKRYGHLLPRERAEVLDGKTMCNSRWAYPLHRIQKMVVEGRLKRLKTNSVV